MHMHSIWQEKIEFPQYPILKKDQKADIVYVGATLTHGIEAHFQKEQGKAVMILEKKVISDMPQLGGLGILKAENRAEEKKLHILRDYIEGRQIPCDMKVVSQKCLWVHPIKLFLFLTEDLPVYEQSSIYGRKGKRMDLGSAYVDAAQIIEGVQRKEVMYAHVFEKEIFLKEQRTDLEEVRTYREFYLASSLKRDLKGSLYCWEI